jgi:hypothetical protein
MAALLMAQQHGHGQTGIIGDQTARGGRGKEAVLGKDAFIGGAELNHQFLFLIMCKKRDIHIIHSSYIF